AAKTCCVQCDRPCTVCTQRSRICERSADARAPHSAYLRHCRRYISEGVGDQPELSRCACLSDDGIRIRTPWTSQPLKELTMWHSLTRREFLKTAGAVGAIGVSSRGFPAADKPVSANERLHVGVIGVRGQGTHDMNGVAEGGAVVAALCDVDEEVLG